MVTTPTKVSTEAKEVMFPRLHAATQRAADFLLRIPQERVAEGSTISNGTLDRMIYHVDTKDSLRAEVKVSLLNGTLFGGGLGGGMGLPAAALTGVLPDTPTTSAVLGVVSLSATLGAATYTAVQLWFTGAAHTYFEGKRLDRLLGPNWETRYAQLMYKRRIANKAKDAQDEQYAAMLRERRRTERGAELWVNVYNQHHGCVDNLQRGR